MHLRYWQVSDAADLLKLYQQVEDLRLQLPILLSLEDARRHIESSLLPAEGRSVFALDCEAKLAGLVAVTVTAEDDEGKPDRGWVYYWSAPVIRGTGAMKESVRAVCDWTLGEQSRQSEVQFREGLFDCSVLTEETSPGLRRLELGYRTNNPASGAVAAAAGFTVEGVEREKFFYDGQAYDAVIAARLRDKTVPPRANVHHIELWTTDFKAAKTCWDWLMEQLGFTSYQAWEGGTSWRAPDGSYLVLEQSADVNGDHQRTRAGLNHLALNCASRQELEDIREQAPKHGWTELFADRYPHAGGEKHTALYLENDEGFEVELVLVDGPK